MVCYLGYGCCYHSLVQLPCSKESRVRIMSEYIKTLSDEQVTNMRDHFYKLGWGQNETMWKCWNQALDYIAPQLSASQAREAALREKPVTAETEKECLSASCKAVTEKLEAAEARGDAYSARAFKAEQEYQTILEHCRALEALIKASQEQEPAIKRYQEFTADGDSIEDPVEALRFFCSLCMKTPQDWLDIERFFDAVIAERAELRKLLEESKVPEGWQLVPKEPTVAMREAIRNHTGCSFLRSKDAYAEVLAAAPQPPKEPKQ